jgi:hypothetical protein
VKLPQLRGAKAHRVVDIPNARVCIFCSEKTHPVKELTAMFTWCLLSVVPACPNVNGPYHQGTSVNISIIQPAGTYNVAITAPSQWVSYSTRSRCNSP